jgi:hypothetical protein
VPQTLPWRRASAPLRPQPARQSQAPVPLLAVSPEKREAATASAEGCPVERSTMGDAVAQPSARRGSRVAQCVRAGKADVDACTRRAGGATCAACGQGDARRLGVKDLFCCRKKEGGTKPAYSRGHNSSFSPYNLANFRLSVHSSGR